jgi:uncharacterized protein (DUF2252 family)
VTSPLPARADLAAAGVSARSRLPLAEHANWAPASDRPDPVALLEEQARTRLPELVPIRYGRMSVSAFAFFRGAALPMAADLGAVPNSGVEARLCGDAHLSNFGLFASPERTLLFDITDFDETLRGPFEWDVKRLAASIVVAGRSRGFDRHASRHAAQRAVQTYRERMTTFAAMRAIDVYYSEVDASGILAFVDKRARPMIESTVRSAARHDALHELPKLTVVTHGRRAIVDRPPVIVHRSEATPSILVAFLEDYRSTLQQDRRMLLDRYELVDVALKVVGVGSVGLGAFIALFESGSDDDPLFLQVKQAEASVLERFLGPSTEPTHGARVVVGQRYLQAQSDVFLGHAVGEFEHRHWYVRQLQDQKASAVVEAMTPDDLEAWGALCGWALARGHARSGEPSTIAGYLGDDDTFDHAVARFAEAYADQTERDFAALTTAIAKGRIDAVTGA